MSDAGPIQKEEWVNPEIRTLDVSETNRFGGRGNDGNARFPDCSKS